MNDRKFTIRPMTRPEVDLAINWAAAEGWNPGLDDAGCFYAADSDGFLIGLLGDEPVATISAVKYGRSFGFLGFYIVKPEYRGQGYGMQIWNAGMDHLKGRNTGLDGVVDQQPNYQKSGFKLAYRNVRYEGRGGGALPDGQGIIELSQLPFMAVEAYDRPFFPDRRHDFLKCWISRPRARALGLLSEGELAGYGVIRTCRSGYKIGPLFADAPDDAEQLFLALRSLVPADASVYLDIPEINLDALAMVEKYDMEVVFETARMYTGDFPNLPANRIFGVTTFELG